MYLDHVRLLSRKKITKRAFLHITGFPAKFRKKANIFALFSTKEMRINAKFLANQKLRNLKQFFNLTGNPNLEAVMQSRIISWIPGQWLGQGLHTLQYFQSGSQGTCWSSSLSSQGTSLQSKYTIQKFFVIFLSLVSGFWSGLHSECTIFIPIENIKNNSRRFFAILILKMLRTIRTLSLTLICFIFGV